MTTPKRYSRLYHNVAATKYRGGYTKTLQCLCWTLFKFDIKELLTYTFSRATSTYDTDYANTLSQRDVKDVENNYGTHLVKDDIKGSLLYKSFVPVYSHECNPLRPGGHIRSISVPKHCKDYNFKNPTQQKSRIIVGSFKGNQPT